MSNNKDLLLVHRGMERVTLVDRVNIMLSPQFYTLKKESLPVKYAYQAKKIAPSLFEGLLDENGAYHYLVRKEEDKWAFIAYDLDAITAFLESKGIGAEKVAKLYFIQESVDALHTPVALNEKEALVVIDHTVVQVPKAALGEEETPSLEVDNSFTPKGGGVTLQGSASSLLTQKQALSLAGVGVLFAGIFLVEGIRYTGESQTQSTELESLYASYPALKSSYTRKGIVEKYRSIDERERKKREAIKAFSSMIFKGVTLTSLHTDEKGFSAQFACNNADVAKRVKALAKKEHYNTAKIKGSTDLRIEGTL